MDGLEFACRVRWKYTDAKWRELWDEGRGRVWRVQAGAREAHEDRPLVLGALSSSLMVHGKGWAINAQHIRLPVRFTYLGCMIALNPDEGTRERPNCFVSIPGKACLLHGVRNLLHRIRGVIAALAGWVEADDEEIRRLDVCLDVPGYCVQRWAKLVEDDLCVTRCHEYKPSRSGRNKLSGFVAGNRSRLHLRAYDKVLELEKKDEEYQAAMVQFRWGGKLPDHATRLEFEMRTEWLREVQVRTVSEALDNLGGLVAKLTQETHAFFRITARQVDRNHNQKRAGVDADWAAAVAAFRELAGEVQAELVRKLDRGQITQKQACSMAVGVLTSAAVSMGVYGDRPADLVFFFAELLRRNGGPQGIDVGERWEIKAGRSGLMAERVDFDVGRFKDEPTF